MHRVVNAHACRLRAQPAQPHLLGSDGKCGKMEKISPCERYGGEEGTRHHSGLLIVNESLDFSGKIEYLDFV